MKNKEKEKENSQSNQLPAVSNSHEEELTTSIDNESNSSDTINSCKPEEDIEDTELSIPTSEDYIPEDQNLNYDVSYASDHSKHPRRKPKSFWDQSSKWSEKGIFAVVSESGGMVSKPDPRIHGDGFRINKPLRTNNNRGNVRSNGSRYGERLYCSHNKSNDRYDPHACSCYQHNDYTDVSKPYYRGNKFNNQTEYVKTNVSGGKKIWEPMETQKRYTPKSNTDAPVKVEPVDPSNGTNSVAINHEHNDLKETKDAVENEVDSISGTTSSNSISDSCSSCLSEGDGNTSFSSNTQNAESSSTSDSEDASHHSEVIKEKENPFPEKQENTKQNETQLPTKTVQFCENDKKNDVMGSIPQGNIIPPPFQAQGIHFPIFHAPSMGYYHQGPVPWVAAAPNGLMPLPHPNHYLFPSPFGYSLNGSSHFLQYGVGNLQPLGPPLVNRTQQPMYQLVAQVNNINMKDDIPGLEKGEKNAELLQNEKSEMTRKSNTDFSLFHFGGPVALSNGSVEIDGSLSSKDAVEVEEYNLFAASNGIRFSF